MYSCFSLCSLVTPQDLMMIMPENFIDHMKVPCMCPLLGGRYYGPWLFVQLSLYLKADDTAKDHEKSTSSADPEIRTVVLLDDRLPELLLATHEWLVYACLCALSVIICFAIIQKTTGLASGLAQEVDYTLSMIVPDMTKKVLTLIFLSRHKGS